MVRITVTNPFNSNLLVIAILKFFEEFEMIPLIYFDERFYGFLRSLELSHQLGRMKKVIALQPLFTDALTDERHFSEPHCIQYLTP